VTLSTKQLQGGVTSNVFKRHRLCFTDLLQEPPPAVMLTTDADAARLLRDLRAVLGAYHQHLLDLRVEWLPGGRKRSEEAALAAALRTRQA
jgi:hypothetical protein